MSISAMTLPDTATTDGLLAALRRQTNQSAMTWSSPPARLAGGFWAEMYVIELTDPPRELAGRLVARVMPDPDTAAFETAVQRHLGRCGFPVPAIRGSDGPSRDLDRAWSLMDFAAGQPLLAGLRAATALKTVPNLLRRLPVSSPRPQPHSTNAPSTGFYGGAMTEFVEQDLSGARFERVDLRNARLDQVHLNDARMRKIDLSGVEIRGALLQGARMLGLELYDVEISGDLKNVTINGVDIGPLVEQELNRREPERAKMRPADVQGFQQAWAIVERRWVSTVERARSLPAEALHARVDGEWSFIETLRHLGFASAAWVGRMILGDPSPWHPLDLPWDEAPGWDGIPWDREARPALDVVVDLRRQRQAMVGGVIASLTDEQLASTVSRTEPGWPQIEAFPLKDCLLIVLNEEWEHRRFAERDLAALETPADG